MEDKTVNILGTEYKVVIDESLEKTEFDGLHNTYSKQVSVRKVDDMLADEPDIEQKQRRFEEVMRHEVMHAFFIESGLTDYCLNEQLVDWFAIQSPKIFKVFKELGVIKD